MKSTATLFLSILLSFSCAKKPEDKYPENYKRDYFSLSPLESKVLLITSKKSEEKNGKRKVIFKKGDERLRSLFRGYELNSKNENEKIFVHFELTPNHLIAFREVDKDQELSLEEKLFTETKKNIKRIPLFFLPIKGFGTFERVKNSLDEETNQFSFKQKERKKSTHVKIGNMENERLLPKIEGLKKVDKENLIDLENELDLTKRYIYVPSTLGAPRDIAQTSPYFQGQEKIVQLGLSEKGIEVYNIDPNKSSFDPLLKKRPSLDETPVLTIPGRYIHIGCKKNLFNQCSSPIYGAGKDLTLGWKSKRFFIPNYEGLRIHEKNLLELQHLKKDGCWNQGDNPRYISHTFRKGVINIQLEKNIKINNLSSKCLNSYWTTRMRHFSFNVRHFYALVSLDNFLPKNKALKYQPVLYPAFDRKVFGFFHTNLEKLNPEGEFKRKIFKSLLSRWNPNRKKNKIYYFLTNTFIEEEKEIKDQYSNLGKKNIPSLREVTEEAINSLNKGLKIAKAPFILHICKPKIKSSKETSITFFEDKECQEKAFGKIGAEGALPGDIRYNTIALIRPSLGNGLLGYGPNVVHPETGEILHAHVNMYEGNLKRQTRSIWTQISSSENRSWLKRKNQLSKEKSEINNESLSLNQDDRSNATPGDDLFNFNENENENENFNTETFPEQSNTRPLKTFNELLTNFKRARQKVLGQNLFFADFLNISQTQKSIIKILKEREKNSRRDKSFFHKNLRVKGWNELEREQKDEIQRILLVHNFKSTLIHEMGHNLGLRHNFMGSVDKDNFYSNKDKEGEFKDFGLKTYPSYSSVMDYAGNAVDSPSIPGKYDIAALRFAYARQVELKNGKIINLGLDSLENKLNQKNYNVEKDLKSYMYCTDFEKSDTAYCNPFDHGHNLSLIADSMIKKYYSDYERINFRDDKNYFSINQTGGYFFSKFYLFNQMRMILSEWDYLKQNKLTMRDQELQIYKEKKCPKSLLSYWPDECKKIEDAVKAAHKIGHFFLSILKEKELTCSIKDYGPNQIPNIIAFYKDNFKEEGNTFLTDFSLRKVVFNYLKSLILNKTIIRNELNYDAKFHDVMDLLTFLKLNYKEENLFEKIITEKKELIGKFGLTSGEDKKERFGKLLKKLDLNETTFYGSSHDKERQTKHLSKLATFLSKLKPEEEKRILFSLKQDLLRPNKKRIKLAHKIKNLKDLSHFNFLPKSCFDRELINYFNEKEKYDVYNEEGRYLIGFNDKNPNFRKTKLKNIAVRGIWPDKILAMESLIQRRPMFGRKVGLMNFLDLPEINKEFTSLLDNSLFNFQSTKAEGSLGSLMIPSYNIPRDLKWILGAQSVGDLLNLKKGMFSFSNIRNGGFNGGLLKNISVKRKNETDAFNEKDHLFFNYDDTIYLAEKENKISFQILSFLKRVELLEKSRPEELQLIIDENKKNALTKEKSDLILAQLNGSIERKENQLRDFFSYKSFNAMDFLNKMVTFFNEKDFDYISFDKYYTLINFKKDYDKARYASKESKIDNLFHKSLGKSRNSLLNLSIPQKSKTAYISPAMFSFSKEIQDKKELIKWGQHATNKIITILENGVENNELNSVGRFMKTSFVPDKADKEKLILEIFKRKDLNKEKVVKTLDAIHFYSFPYKSQLELNARIEKLFKNHTKTKSIPFNKWPRVFEDTMTNKEKLFEDVKNDVSNWALSKGLFGRVIKDATNKDFNREEKTQINLVLKHFFKNIELIEFPDEVRENLLKKIDLNYYTYKSLPKSTIKSLSNFFKTLLSDDNPHLPEEIRKINQSIKYQLKSSKKGSKYHLNNFMEICDKIKINERGNETGNNEELKKLKKEAILELRSFLGKFHYPVSLTEKHKIVLSSFSKDISDFYFKEKESLKKDLNNFDKNSSFYLKGKIKSIENELIFNEFNFILKIENNIPLKTKIKNNYKELLNAYKEAIVFLKAEKRGLTYHKTIHEKRNLNFQTINYKSELSESEIKEMKKEITRKRRFLSLFRKSIPRYLEIEKNTLYLKFFNNFLKNFSQNYNNLFNLTYNWFYWRKNKDFSFKNNFYSEEDIPGCDPMDWSANDCKDSIQNLILKKPHFIYKKGEELSYLQMKKLIRDFKDILRFNYNEKPIFDNEEIPNKITSLNIKLKNNSNCKSLTKMEFDNSENNLALKRSFNLLFNCTKNLFELGVNNYISHVEKDLDSFLEAHITDYYHGPYPSIFNKYLRNKSFFQKFKESGLMVLTLPKKNQQKIIAELKNTYKNNRRDEIKIQDLEDLFLFELETFNSKDGRGLLLNLKKTYQQVLKTLPTEWKRNFSK